MKQGKTRPVFEMFSKSARPRGIQRATRLGAVAVMATGALLGGAGPALAHTAPTSAHEATAAPNIQHDARQQAPPPKPFDWSTYQKGFDEGKPIGAKKAYADYQQHLKGSPPTFAGDSAYAKGMRQGLIAGYIDEMNQHPSGKKVNTDNSMGMAAMVNLTVMTMAAGADETSTPTQSPTTTTTTTSAPPDQGPAQLTGPTGANTTTAATPPDQGVTQPTDTTANTTATTTPPDQGATQPTTSGCDSCGSTAGTTTGP